MLSGATTQHPPEKDCLREQKTNGRRLDTEAKRLRDINWT